MLDFVDVTLPASGAGAPRVEVARADRTTVDSTTEALLRSLTPAYCTRYAKAVSVCLMARPLSRDAFLGYVLEVMRRASAAEIAVVNRSLAKRGAFPLSGAVTRGDLERALPYHP